MVFSWSEGVWRLFMEVVVVVGCCHRSHWWRERYYWKRDRKCWRKLSLGEAIEESCTEFSLLSSSSLPPKSFQTPTPESVTLASRQNRQSRDGGDTGVTRLRAKPMIVVVGSGGISYV
ncbi:hypothetical protein ACSQ67_004896 [Phaseolus vulgaris]